MAVFLLAGAAAVSGAAPAVAQTTQPAADPAPTRVTRRTFIAAPPDRVWKALYDKELVSEWFPAILTEVDFRVGGKLVLGSPEDPFAVCEILDIRDKKRLQYKLDFLRGPEMLAKEPPSRVTLELKSWGPSTELNITHDQLEDAPYTAKTTGPTWDGNIARLKTLLETGRPLVLSWAEAEEQRATPDATSEPADRFNPLAFLRGVTLFVEDMQQARPWYEQTFALPPRSFSQDWMTLSMASPSITVKEATLRERTKPGEIALRFFAEDVEGLHRRLKSQGVPIVSPLKRTQYTADFVFASPEGFRFHVQGPAIAPDGHPAPQATQTRPSADDSSNGQGTPSG